jgi:hypothetical protein
MSHYLKNRGGEIRVFTVLKLKFDPKLTGLEKVFEEYGDKKNLI